LIKRWYTWCWYAIVVIWALHISACSSNLQHVDAIPLGGEKSSWGGAISYRGEGKDRLSIGTDTISDISIFPLDVYFQAGIAENTDLLLSFTLPITLEVSLKHTVTGPKRTNGYFFAVGPSLGLDLISLFDTEEEREFEEEEESDPPLYFSMELPFYNTFRFAPGFTISVIPTTKIRYDYRFFQFLSGASALVRIGSSSGVSLEGSVVYNARYKSYEKQIGVGFYR